MLLHFAFTTCLSISAVLADRRQEHRQFAHHVGLPASHNATYHDTEFYNNWSGALWNENQGTFIYVTGKFTVPVPSGPANTGASIFVGIDGNTCQSAMLSTGIYVYPDGNGGSTYLAFYQWHPDWTQIYSDVSISAGDVIEASITVNSPTSGVASINNISTGQEQQVEVTSTFPLCESDAEWVVGSLVDKSGNSIPLANFGTVTFGNALASSADTGTYGPGGANLAVMRQNGYDLTFVSADSNVAIITYE